MATTKTATNPKRRQPKRRQIQNGDNQNGDKSKTATNQNGYTPKRRQPRRRQPKRCMSPYWIQPKWRQIQNGDTSKRRQIQDGDIPKRCLVLSPFWRLDVLDTSKHSVWDRNQVGFVAVLACRRFGFVAVLDLSPFWPVPDATTRQVFLRDDRVFQGRDLRQCNRRRFVVGTCPWWPPGAATMFTAVTLSGP